MAKRSIQASSAGIQRAKRAFSLKGWTQENLAGEVNLKTRQPIWRFFSGRPVDRYIFMEICSILDLNWREIADHPPAEFPNLEIPAEIASFDLDGFVQEVRAHHYDAIQNQCGILQLLDINHPVSLTDIYVDVNILEEVTSQQWAELSNLQSLGQKDFDRVGLGNVEQQQIPGTEVVEKYSKLRVLGKPGVGKTTFLKYLAIQCSQSEFAVNQVPIFISLKEFAEESRAKDNFSLFNYIHQAFLSSGISNSTALEALLQAGRVLLLLDGMDEVLNQDITAVLKEIRKFSDKYHKNRFVVSCRTAAQKLQLRGFTDVEIAPFSQEQIIIFSQKWFVALTKTTAQSGRDQANQFIEKLELPENWKFRQLVVTPLFLHLACWIFQGQGRFPKKRTEFYRQGLDLLLGKWDESKGVERDDIYREFLLPQKLRLLSQLAAVTFEHGQYFFETRTVENYIGDFLQNLPGMSLEPEELQLESEAILKAVEAQHGLLIERARGIFSFSCLAFQEYFTARKIVASHNLQSLEQALGDLVVHITDPHWHEIFLLTTSMLRNADSLVQLMKQQIDCLVKEDPYLQEFLGWASQKSQTVPDINKLATTRAFYLSLPKAPHLAARFALASSLDQGMILDAVLESLMIEMTTTKNEDFAYINACIEGLNNMMVMVLDAGFYKSLQQLKEQLPLQNQHGKKLHDWWQTSHAAWIEELKATVSQYRNIHHAWNFSPEQQQILQRYYDANQLLIDCLNSACEVTEATRTEIEATLLLPQRELEDREWEGD